MSNPRGFDFDTRIHHGVIYNGTLCLTEAWNAGRAGLHGCRLKGSSIGAPSIIWRSGRVEKDR
jgi:hypothetical protein